MAHEQNQDNQSREVATGAARAAIPAHIRELFGEPPVLCTENRDAYERLLSELVIEIEPLAIREWLWVRDLADITWDILRLRRVTAYVLNISFKPALIETLNAVLPTLEGLRDADALADAWYDDPDGRARVVATLARYGITPEAVAGQAFVLRCHELEKIERMLTSAESRRNAIMRELQVYRESSVSKKARHAIIDADPAQLLAAEILRAK